MHLPFAYSSVENVFFEILTCLFLSSLAFINRGQ